MINNDILGFDGVYFYEAEKRQLRVSGNKIHLVKDDIKNHILVCFIEMIVIAFITYYYFNSIATITSCLLDYFHKYIHKENENIVRICLTTFGFLLPILLSELFLFIDSLFVYKGIVFDFDEKRIYKEKVCFKHVEIHDVIKLSDIIAVGTTVIPSQLCPLRIQDNGKRGSGEWIHPGNYWINGEIRDLVPNEKTNYYNVYGLVFLLKRREFSDVIRFGLFGEAKNISKLLVEFMASEWNLPSVICESDEEIVAKDNYKYLSKVKIKPLPKGEAEEGQVSFYAERKILDYIIILLGCIALAIGIK